MKICEQINKGLSEIKAHIAKNKALLDALITANTAKEIAEIRKQFNELVSSEGPKIATKLAELKELSEAMKALDLDYKDSIATLEEFKVIEKKENGEIFYKGDYDPSKEKGYNKNNESKDKHYLGKEYTMPTLEDIFARITPEQIRLYYEMKEQGLEPRLQLTPIAKAIIIRDYNGTTKGGLAKHIDDYKGYPKKTENTSIWDEIKDEELIYEPENYETSEDGKELITKGGKSKSKWIEEKYGWLIDIVSTAQVLKPDSEITTDNKGEEYTNAEKTALYHEKYTKQGYKGLTYESYILAQMRALRNRKPLDRYKDSIFTILTDSSIRNTTLVSDASWNYDQVHLDRSDALNQDFRLRWRRAVRIP